MQKRRLPTLLVCRLGPSTALQVTCRVTAYAGILHVPPEKCALRILYTLTHTSGYKYCIPVAFTSDIVFDLRLMWKFQTTNRQSIDDAFTLCSVPPIRPSLKMAQRRHDVVNLHIFSNTSRKYLKVHTPIAIFDCKIPKIALKITNSYTFLC